MKTLQVNTLQDTISNMYIFKKFTVNIADTPDLNSVLFEMENIEKTGVKREDITVIMSQVGADSLPENDLDIFTNGYAEDNEFILAVNR
jgi:hypothetical protein